MSKMPEFKKQDKNEKVLTIVYFISLILVLVILGFNYAKVLEDYYLFFAFAFLGSIQIIRQKKYKNKKLLTTFIIFTILSMVIGLLDLIIGI